MPPRAARSDLSNGMSDWHGARSLRKSVECLVVRRFCGTVYKASLSFFIYYSVVCWFQNVVVAVLLSSSTSYDSFFFLPQYVLWYFRAFALKNDLRFNPHVELAKRVLFSQGGLFLITCVAANGGEYVNWGV